MTRSMVNGLCLAATLAVAPLLAGCGATCAGCGDSCPVKPGQVFNITLLPTGAACKSLPQLSNTLAQLSVLQLATRDGQTVLTASLTSFIIPLDVSLTGSICTANAGTTSYPYSGSFVQRSQLTGPLTSYSINGTINGPQGQLPTTTGTLSITYSDPAKPSAGCSTQATFSST